jgi:predicted Zn-dependent protease
VRDRRVRVGHGPRRADPRQAAEEQIHAGTGRKDRPRSGCGVRKQYPIIQDEGIAGYLATIGDRLVAAAPSELKQPVYAYSFTPVNLKEINAFALPGGPMFVQCRTCW